MPRKKEVVEKTVNKEKETALAQETNFAQETDLPQETVEEAKTEEPNAADTGIDALSAASGNDSSAVNKSARTNFYDIDFNKLDRGLSPEQLKEWTAIYASFRSRTPLAGTVIGVDSYKLPVTDPVTKITEPKTILCLVIMDYRIKVILPQTEVWYEPEKVYPDYVIRGMIGAKVNYVITDVDRTGDCAIASRRMALNYERRRFFNDDRRNTPGQLQICRVLVVGPSRLTAECNGIDLILGTRDLSYTAITDLRKVYRPGQELKCKLINSDSKTQKIEIAIKEVNPNPFDGADLRHPVGSTRQAVISGKYAGGVFCTLPDDTTCLCLYSPNYFKEELYIGDSVLILLTFFDYSKKQIYGRLLSKK